MKLTYIYAKTDGTLTVAYTNPSYGKDEPTSPAVGDYWFDTDNETWKTYNGTSFTSAGATLVGYCLQDTSATVAARSFEFFQNYDSDNTIEILAESNSQVKSRRVGAKANVWGVAVRFDQGLTTWDMTLDLESGVTEAASTYYYFYVTEEGDKIISDKKPHDRREDLEGWYHPHHSWRCVGWAFNNASSNLEQIESYYHARESEVIRSVIATDFLLTRDRVILLSGASFTEYLPPAASCKGNIYTFLHNGTSLSMEYTLEGFSSETIGGSTSVKLQTNGQVLKIISDGSNWLILDSKTTTTPTSFTPDLTHTTNTTATGYWWRVGCFLHARVRAAYSGAPQDVDLVWTLMSGPTINTTMFPTSSGVVCGTAYAIAASSFLAGDVLMTSSTTVTPRVINVDAANSHNGRTIDNGTGNLSATIGSGDSSNLLVAVPITDWLP